MAIFLAFKLIVLLAVCGLGPGLLIARALRFSPLEKLCAAFAASFVCIYLASFGLFFSNAGLAGYWAIAGLFLVMGMAGRRSARLFLLRRSTRSVLLAFGAILIWDFLHLAIVRHYDGGDWAVDWSEHFDRTCYFLHLLPTNYQFVGTYALPARPPMMNLIAAFFCRLTTIGFESYSLAFLFLNAWAFVPCCLLLRIFAPRQKRLTVLLAILFMLNPSIIENATLTVTKAMTAGWVVLGVCFYLRSFKSPRQTARLIAAALSLAAAILTHYSAVPYALAVGLHCLFARFRRRSLIAAGAAALALLATWFLWSIGQFGLRRTFTSASLTTGMPETSVAENLRRMAYNLFTSLVPHPLHSTAWNPEFTVLGNLHNWGDLRDFYFMIVQTTLPTMIGLTGGAVVIVVLLKNRCAPPLRRFWTFFVVFSYVVGIAVNYGWNATGCAQVTMQPMAMMGVTFLTGKLMRLARPMFFIVVAGIAVDYGLGIYLQFDRQGRIYPTVVGAGGHLMIYPDSALGRVGYGEYVYKLQARLVFWGDHLAARGDLLRLASIAGAVVAIGLLIRFWNAHRDRRITWA